MIDKQLIELEKKYPKQKYIQNILNLGYGISDEDRFFVYLWYEKNGNEIKYGDRWVSAGIDPVFDIFGYVPKSMGRRSDLFTITGDAQLYKIWDATELAKSVNKFRPNGKIDDFIRGKVFPKISRRGKTDAHDLSHTDATKRVDAYFSKLNQDKPVAHLSTAQYNETKLIIDAYNEGYRRFIAEHCPRFGKTIQCLAVPTELQFKLIIVASYVNTSYRSFENDITTFDQFKHYVYVDSRSRTYKEQIEQAFSENKPVIVYVSLTQSKNRSSRFEYLFSLPYQRYCIIDEADYGAHRKGQYDVISNNINENDVLYLMTGTNSDRAVSEWTIDFMTATTYFELLVQKAETQKLLDDGKIGVSNPHNLKYFQCDPERDLLYPSLECYQLSLIEAIEYAIKHQKLDESDFAKLPSWSKFSKNPVKAKGWFVTLLQAMFNGQHNLDHINIDYQNEMNVIAKRITNSEYEAESDRRVAMMFFGERTSTDTLDSIENIAQRALPEYKVCVLHGKKTSQKEAERYVLETMEKYPNHNILIISSILAQRSFSNGDITELYLAYDKGQESSTIQKIARVLTPKGIRKVGRVYSLSFDPNRDDKFSALIIETVKRLVDKKGRSNTDIRIEMLNVLQSIDFFSCTNDGPIRFELDHFIKESLGRKFISRAMGTTTNISNMPADIIAALANGDLTYIKNVKKEAAKMGKTSNGVNRKRTKTSTTNPTQTQLQKVKEMLSAIYEHSDVLLYSAKDKGASNIRTAFSIFEKLQWEELISNEFGVDYEIIKYLFEEGYINEDWVNLLHGGAWH